MTWGDVQHIRDVDGPEYLEYSERQTKWEQERKFEISDQSDELHLFRVEKL